MGLNINNNNIPNNITSQEVIQTSLDQNPSNSIFDKIFTEEEKELLDGDKNGTVTLEEAKNYVRDNNAGDPVVLKLAKYFCIEADMQQDEFMFKNNILNFLNNIFPKVDTNKDNNITDDEIENVSDLNNTDKNQLYKAFGIVNGNLDNNKQGAKGSCWLLTGSYGLAQKDETLFREVVKKGDDGFVTVTFYGTPDGEPFEYKIHQKVIIALARKRTEAINEAVLNNKTPSGEFGSSDPDAIALEMAMTKYNHIIERENKNKTSKLEEEIKNYIEHSEPSIINKPDVSNLSLSVTKEEWNKLINYLFKESLPERNMLPFPTYDKLTESDIENMKKLIQDSTPKQIEKPDINNLPPANIIKFYLEHSYSDTVKKPNAHIDRTKSPGSMNGGKLTSAIKTMVGGTAFSYYNFNDDNTLSKAEKTAKENKIKEVLSNLEPKKIYSATFKENDGIVIKNHAYYISKTEGNTVYLVDPHNTAEEIKYPIKRFLKNFEEMGVNTLPEKIS